MVYTLHEFQCDPLDIKCCCQGLSDMEVCVQDALLIVKTSLSLSVCVEINTRILSHRAYTFQLTDCQE